MESKFEKQEAKICPICSLKQRLMFESKKHFYFRCPKCELVSTHPFPSGATLEAHYKQKFTKGNYQLLRQYSQQYVRVYLDLVQHLHKTIQRHGLDFQGLKVLDVGCFTGEFLGLLQEQGADVYGLELQTKAVQIASKKLDGRVFKADVFSNNFPQMKFDIITLLGVIEHVREPIKLLRCSTELLNDGGFLMIQTPDSSSLLAKVMGKFWPPYAPVEHIHLFSKKSLNLALKQLGFKDLVFKRHLKKLPIGYVYNMFQNFGPEFYRLLKPIYVYLPGFITKISLPFYIGEIILTARNEK